jgi:hypothetical protein
MSYAVEMGSSAMIYIPSLIKIGSGIQKLTEGGYRHTHRQHRDRISLLSFFFQNKERGLKITILKCFIKKNVDSKIGGHSTNSGGRGESLRFTSYRLLHE